MSFMDHQQFNPATRGFHAVYRAHETNHCPGCGRSHWIIGRVSAECAFCSTALPLAVEKIVGEPTLIYTRGKGGPEPVFRGEFILNGQTA
jgi:hypothetical protein